MFYCTLDAISCSSNPCQNGATCVNRLEAYECVCAHGWTGVHCETGVTSQTYRVLFTIIVSCHQSNVALLSLLVVQIFYPRPFRTAPAIKCCTRLPDRWRSTGPYPSSPIHTVSTSQCCQRRTILHPARCGPGATTRCNTWP